MAARSLDQFLSAHSRTILAGLVLIGAALRLALVLWSPTPFGYIWDYYHEGVRILYEQGRLPASTECWQCYHPPFFYLAGYPFYAVGQWIQPGTDSAASLRLAAGMALFCGALIVWYSYRLLALYECRGSSLVIGIGLTCAFPCLFISSYGAEADILLGAILAAFIYYLARDYARATPAHTSAAIRLGILAGLAAATKYSGLAGIAAFMVLMSMRLVSRAERSRALQHVVIVAGLCCALAGWKYVDNFKRYGTPMFANGPAAEGFSLGSRAAASLYEFTTFRVRELYAALDADSDRRQLTELPVYRSVFTTLHALAWSDMSFFSVRGRHGDGGQPYPDKRIPRWLSMATIMGGLLPTLLAVVGACGSLTTRAMRPVLIAAGVSLAAYLWWVLGQEVWALKTKYLLFLVPTYVLLAVQGLQIFRRRLGWIYGEAVVWGLAVLVLISHVYLLAFAIGRLE